MISGFKGVSKAELIPVKSLINPARAFLYKPQYLSPQTSNGQFTNISKKSPLFTTSLNASRSFLNGETKAHKTISPASNINLATSLIRLIFFTYLYLKPKSLFNPNRTLSPSNKYVLKPCSFSANSTSLAIVDFPEPERPVNHNILAFCDKFVLFLAC